MLINVIYSIIQAAKHYTHLILLGAYSCYTQHDTGCKAIHTLCKLHLYQFRDKLLDTFYYKSPHILQIVYHDDQSNHAFHHETCRNILYIHSYEIELGLVHSHGCKLIRAQLSNTSSDAKQKKKHFFFNKKMFF